LGLAITGTLAFLACGGSLPAQAPEPVVADRASGDTSAVDRFSDVPEIVDPSNRGWPRVVEGLGGRVTIASKPLRIHTLSLGLDEITYALVPASRVVAVGRFTQNPDHSNVAGLAGTAPAIPRDTEEIVAHNPDIVVASPFAKAELLDALTAVGVTVLRAEHHETLEGRILDILFLGYVYGEEERALALASEVRSRLEGLEAFTRTKPPGERPRVLSLNSYSGNSIFTSGAGSTVGDIIEFAGGINGAAQAGIKRAPSISIEGIVAIWPDVIIIPQPADGAEALKRDLLAHEALAQIPAIKEGRIHPVGANLFTTLSFWNLRGAEELAQILWPRDAGDLDPGPFSSVE
jgi:iron complex transport system substrate-binding protein